ncbi:MAG: PEP/pyruvate-binding domain-containing protein, partial [Rhodoluna sp.]
MSNPLAELGGKARNLLALEQKFRVYVPFFRAIPFTELFVDLAENKANLENIIAEYLGNQKTLEETILALESKVTSFELNLSALEEIQNNFAAKNIAKISVRTSAALEDGIRDSFAGQYETFLDLAPSLENLKVYARKSFQSVFSA